MHHELVFDVLAAEKAFSCVRVIVIENENQKLISSENRIENMIENKISACVVMENTIGNTIYPGDEVLVNKILNKTVPDVVIEVNKIESMTFVDDDDEVKVNGYKNDLNRSSRKMKSLTKY